MFHFDFLKFEIKNRTFPDTEEVTLFENNEKKEFEHNEECE